MRASCTKALFAVLTIVLCTGLAAAQKAGPDDLVWPSPPEQPRIKYVGYVRSEQDIGRSSSMLGKFKRSLVGGREEFDGLVRPHDVHATPDGMIYVTDRVGGGRVLGFDPDEKRARPLELSGSGRLGKPMGLGGDRLGNLYIADASSRRAVMVGPDGAFVRAIGGRDVLLNPVDVAASADGSRIYVIDSYLHQLVIFDAEGEVVGRVGRDEGDLSSKRDMPTVVHGDGQSLASSDPSDLRENRSTEPGEFRYPAFVSVGPRGQVYVTDCMNFRIQVFEADGTFVRAIGSLGQTPGSLARPKGIGVDSQGHIYVADAAFNNIQIFDGEGRLLMAFGGMGEDHGEFWQPIGIGVVDDRVYAVDRFNNRVQIFDYLHMDQTGAVSLDDTEKES